MMKITICTMICSFAMVFSCNALRGQDSDREVTPVDKSVHAGVDEQKRVQQPQPDQGQRKLPTPLTTWSSSQAKQPAETLSWRAGTITPEPGNTDHDKIGSLTKLPNVSSNLPFQHSFDKAMTTPGLKAHPPAAAAEPETQELFAPLDRKPFGTIDNTPFSNSESHPPKDTILTVRGKPSPPKPKRGNKVGLTPSSVETAKHE